MGHVQHANRLPQNRFSRSAEAVAWVTGIVLLVTSGARYVEGVTSSRKAIVHFAKGTKTNAPEKARWNCPAM